MDKINNELQEFYDANFLRARVLESMRDYMSKPENETGEKITELPQIQFDYVLTVAGRSVFGGMDTQHDYLLLCLLCVVYIEIVTKYNKYVSLEAFASFVNLPVEFVRTWENDQRSIKKGLYLDNIITELTTIYRDTNYNYNNLNENIYSCDAFNSWGELITAVNGSIFVRLQNVRENSIKSAFLQAKQQLGAIALVNREFGWSADTVTQVERARALSLSDLPKLQSYVNPQKQIESLET